MPICFLFIMRTTFLCLLEGLFKHNDSDSGHESEDCSDEDEDGES